jgi:hypothetical protein
MPTPDGWHNHADDAVRHEHKRFRATDLLEAMRRTGVLKPDPEVDNAYRERNQLVAALIRLTDWPAWAGFDAGAPGYTVVYVESPAGQLSWHVRDDELDQFGPLPLLAGKWDGHTTREKYERLATLRWPD